MTTPFLPLDITRDEGCVLRAYQDRGGVWTIGVGHTGKGVHPGLGWTMSDAMGALHNDIVNVTLQLDKQLSWWRQLNDARQDVLVNMCFNLGIHNLLAFHHTIAAIEGDQYGKAAADMLASEPWHSQIGKRCDRLAEQMRTGSRTV